MSQDETTPSMESDGEEMNISTIAQRADKAFAQAIVFAVLGKKGGDTDDETIEEAAGAISTFMNALADGRYPSYEDLIKGLVDAHLPKLSVVSESGIAGEIMHRVLASNPRDGTSHTVLVTSSCATAWSWVNYLKTRDASSLLLHSVIGITAMSSARHLANKIASVTEEQGSATYATKAHMKAWAKTARSRMDYALAIVWGRNVRSFD